MPANGAGWVDSRKGVFGWQGQQADIPMCWTTPSGPCEAYEMIDFRRASEQERATQFALWRAIALVLFPGLAFAIGLIALLMPARPPISTVYGCYRRDPLPLIRVSQELISVDDREIGPIQMSIEKGKEGYVINATTGFSFQTEKQGTKQVIRDYPLGELIPVFISQNRPPSLGLLSDGEQIKIPKVDCPRQSGAAANR